MIYRNTSEQYEGPYKFIFKENETICVQTSRGRKLFLSNVVKPCAADSRKELGDEPISYLAKFDQEVSEDDLFEIIFEDLCRILFNEEDDSAFSTFVLPTDGSNFRDARQTELQGISEGNVFEQVPRSSVPKDERIYGIRFIDALKSDGKGNWKKKARLIAQNFKDKNALKILPRSPTISRMAQRVFLSIAPSYPKKKIYLRDIIQAYIQSLQNIARTIYFEPVPEMGLPKSVVLKAIKPLYGIPESGLLWFSSYSGHHVSTLGMTQSKVDECFFFQKA